MARAEIGLVGAADLSGAGTDRPQALETRGLVSSDSRPAYEANVAGQRGKHVDLGPPAPVGVPALESGPLDPRL
jgi:hypothetical protein